MKTSSFGLSQIIDESTDILNYSASGIDLIFTSHPNLVVYSAVDLSLHPNCHHQIVFVKLFTLPLISDYSGTISNAKLLLTMILLVLQYLVFPKWSNTR